MDSVIIDFNAKLGSGESGSVFAARHTETKERLAVKRVRLGPVFGGFDDEARIVKLLAEVPRHPNLLTLYAAVENRQEGFGFIYMDLVAPETLEHTLECTSTAFDVRDVHETFAQVVAAVGVLHRHEIAHRDIKPENISYDRRRRRAVLFDFGLSEHVAPRHMLAATQTFKGSPLFMPPECVGLKDSFPYAQDMWALGQLLYILYQGESMFIHCQTRTGLLRQMTQRARPFRIPAGVDQNHAELLRRLCRMQPGDRPSIEQVEAFMHNNPPRVCADDEMEVCASARAV